MKEAIEETSSIKEAIAYLDRIPAGGNYKHFQQWAKTHGLEVKKGATSTVGDPFRRKHTDVDMFSENSPCTRQMVRRRILSDNLLEYQCSICGSEAVHNGSPLSLHLDHVNGVSTDHRLENLRFLCPNCHSQTSTYGGRRKQYEINTEGKSYKETSYSHKRKVSRPPYEDLVSMVELQGYSATGRVYGVSDNAIRKWIKHYEKYGTVT